MAENYLIIGRGPKRYYCGENIRSSNNKGRNGAGLTLKGDKHSEIQL